MTVEVINKSRHKLPAYETAGAAGMDLRANLEYETSTMIIGPGRIQTIPTGIYVAVPEGYEIQIRSRSGLSAKHGLIVLNAPGTIDSDYRGEIKLIMYNAGPSQYCVTDGERLAQMVLNKVERIDLVPVDALTDTERGEKGFGSTGV